MIEYPKKTVCRICESSLSNYNYTTHFRKHNLSKETYFEKYASSEIIFKLNKKFIFVKGQKISKSSIKKLNSCFKVNSLSDLKLIIKSRTFKANFYMDNIIKQYLNKEIWTNLSHIEFFKQYCEIRNYTGEKGESYEWNKIKYGKEIAVIKRNNKSNRVNGNKNPAYQHGGRLSPFSEKFLHGDIRTKTIAKLIKTKSNNPQNDTTKIEYYLAQGLDLEKAKEALAKRQSTFSLKICISKHGQKLGKELWLNRQHKWQKSLSLLSNEEIQIINQKKGTGRMNQLFKSNPEMKMIIGTLYYIKFYNDEIEFYKIGITSRTISKRFWNENKVDNKSSLRYKILYKEQLPFYDCFKREQRILKEYKEHRISIDYNGFKTTEAFNENIINEII